MGGRSPLTGCERIAYVPIMPVAGSSDRGQAVTTFVSPLTAALAVALACAVVLMGVATKHGLAGLGARAIMDLGDAMLWLLAFGRWRSAGDEETRRFWRLIGWASLGVGGYSLTAGLADLLDVAWLGLVAVGCLAIAAPLLVSGIATRSTSAEGPNAGWSTVLDVGIIVLAVGGPFAPFLIAPAWGTHDVREITLAGIWLILLFGAGAFLLAAFRTPVNRAPYGLVLMSAMMAVLTLAGILGAYSMATSHGAPPWWADSIYGVGVLIGLEAPRHDTLIESPATGMRTAAAWSMARSVLPYFVFVPLMSVTLVAGFASPVSDFTKSLIATAVLVSMLVGLRQLLQVLDNRRLVQESLQMLETSRRSESEIAKLSKAKSELMSNLNHEFRNALTGIQGFSEIMRDQDLAPDEVKTFATDIYNDSERLTRMITQMLDLDRMEAGRVKLELKPVDLNAKVNEAVDRAQVASSKCLIETSLDARIPPVEADGDRLFQVVANLLSNAVKYSPDGGEVRIRTALEGEEVHVSVVDHGLGIAPEDLSRLFQRYERIGSDGHKIGGTGLGLVITRQIVEMHGGRIWADSRPGAGSEFHFTIPVARRQPASPPAAETQKAA